MDGLAQGLRAAPAGVAVIAGRVADGGWAALIAVGILALVVGLAAAAGFAWCARRRPCPCCGGRHMSSRRLDKRLREERAAFGLQR